MGCLCNYKTLDFVTFVVLPLISCNQEICILKNTKYLKEIRVINSYQVQMSAIEKRKKKKKTEDSSVRTRFKKTKIIKFGCIINT